MYKIIKSRCIPQYKHSFPPRTHMHAHTHTHMHTENIQNIYVQQNVNAFVFLFPRQHYSQLKSASDSLLKTCTPQEEQMLKWLAFKK